MPPGLSGAWGGVRMGTGLGVGEGRGVSLEVPESSLGLSFHPRPGSQLPPPQHGRAGV